jgi:hypothetical protein
MHLSKRVFYIAIIGYSAALLVMWDFAAGINSIGSTSYAFLGKMIVDIVFIGMAAVRLLGPTFFASDDDEDDIGIHEEDLHFSDTALFGLFTVDLLANGGFHAYLYANTTGLESSYYLIWTLVEVFGVFFCGMLWNHAAKAQKRLARKAKEAAAARAAGVSAPASQGQASSFRRVS